MVMTVPSLVRRSMNMAASLPGPGVGLKGSTVRIQKANVPMGELNSGAAGVTIWVALVAANSSTPVRVSTPSSLLSSPGGSQVGAGVQRAGRIGVLDEATGDNAHLERRTGAHQEQRGDLALA